ncbi:helix-turn-helix domain-containing protein [Shewanella spartinae]|uniref:helix-turn-helix domain-containing protein n=1 Tax=Shewanella spartinae TaxID=2864205 RepID=UPI001C654A62|nr:helix-turn-helix domain-containing protein [Shewanella spartinae]QYJ93629.1 helix-turn-helix domain-containing protein [Shewanella spartinae]
MIQQGTGALQATATVISNAEAAIYHAHVGTKSSTVAELDRSFTGIVFPLSWRRDFRLNGTLVDSTSIYTPVDGSLFLAHGWERETVAIAISRNTFLETISALNAIDPNEKELYSGAIQIPSEAAAFSRRSIVNLIASMKCVRHCYPSQKNMEEFVVKKILANLTDLYQQATPLPHRERRRNTKLGKIVRDAEEYFEAVGAGPISLADLCSAASVSQGTLYHAFGVVSGETPMMHFKKRRLTEARLSLLSSDNRRGAVKVAALSHGFSHFGRFAEEYFSLFGEYPKTTLSK